MKQDDARTLEEALLMVLEAIGFAPRCETYPEIEQVMIECPDDDVPP